MLIRISRVVALAVDLILCALLVLGALVPARLAGPMLTFGFGFAGGVITTAVFSYVARGALDEGILTLVAAVTRVVMAVLLSRHRTDRKIGRQPVGGSGLLPEQCSRGLPGGVYVCRPS